MKLNILWIVLLTFWLTGCSDFLTESSQDEVRPSTVDDMEQLLIGEVYTGTYNENFSNATEYFTDDKQCNGLVDEKSISDRNLLEKYRWQFVWQKEMFDENGGCDDPRFWTLPYQKIKGCNVILDYIDNVIGDNKKRESLRGEALAMRGYYYLTLVNFFGLPYNSGDPEKNLGIPLKLHMDVTDKLFTRNTVAEVYRQIEKDLLEANRLLEVNGTLTNFNRVGHLAVKVWLSRMYLYMENWDKALEYANLVLDIKPELLDLSKLNFGRFDYDGVYYRGTSTEIIWARAAKGYNTSGNTSTPPYSLSQSFIQLFDYTPDKENYGDLRGKFYVLWYTDEEWTSRMEFIQKDRKEGNDGLRTAELYLNRAEVYVHKYMEKGIDEYRVKALADLNYLRLHRYDTRGGVVYRPVECIDAQLLFDFYKDERRRELCGEDNHRWCDLRRYGMPELKHNYFVKKGEVQSYALRQGDSRYVLPIPEAARKANAKLEPNP